jgi:hypothetical protein
MTAKANWRDAKMSFIIKEVKAIFELSKRSSYLYFFGNYRETGGVDKNAQTQAR